MQKKMKIVSHLCAEKEESILVDPLYAGHFCGSYAHN